MPCSHSGGGTGAGRAGNTALMAAASTSKADLTVLEYLLERGADVNAQSSKGFTPLIWAARSCSTPLTLTSPRLADM